MVLALDPSSRKDQARLRREYAQRAARLSGSDVYALSNPAHLFMIQQRQRLTLRLLRDQKMLPLSDKVILEVGSGGGSILYEYLGYDAVPKHLHGIDILNDRLAESRRLLPHVNIHQADGQHLPFRSNSFDLVMQYTAFSSVLDESIKSKIAREMRRVLKSGGTILWYDFWLNPTNAQTQGIPPPEIRSLFPNSNYAFNRVTLAPPLIRRLIRVSWVLCMLLESIKLFNTHYLVAIRPLD